MTYFICCTLTKAACVFIVKVIKERRNPTIVLVFQMLRLEKVRETEIFYNVKCGKILSELTSPKVTWPEMTSPKVTWPEMLSPEVTWPEPTVTGPEMIACACPNFSRAFFLQWPTWLQEVPQGHMTPKGFPWRVRKDTFCTTTIVRKKRGVSVTWLPVTTFPVMWLPVTSLPAIFSYTCYLIFLVHDVIKHFIFPSFFPRTFSNRIVWNTRTMVGFLRSLMTLTMNTHAAFVNVQQMKYVIGSGKYYIWNNMLKNRTNVLFINIIIPMHILIM